jgi:hypothetical protein
MRTPTPATAPSGRHITDNGRNGSVTRYNVLARSNNVASTGAFTFITDALWNLPSYMEFRSNISYLRATSGRTKSDTNGNFPAQNFATYNNNIWDDPASGSNVNVSSYSPIKAYTQAELYAALGFADKQALADYAILHPEAHVQRKLWSQAFAGYKGHSPALENLTTHVDVTRGWDDGSVFIGTSPGSKLSTVSGLPAGITLDTNTHSWQYDGSGSGASSGSWVVRETLNGVSRDSTISWSARAPPTLSSPTSSSVTGTTATIGATTDGTDGDLFYIVDKTSNYFGTDTLFKGRRGDVLNHFSTLSYLDADKYGSQAISSAGAKTFNVTGLTPSSQYWYRLMHKNAAGTYSADVGGTFTTTSSFSPGSLAGLKLWIEADPTKLYTDAGTTLVSADGQAVYQANDKSGNGNNLTNNVSGERPLYRTGGGKPYLEFDGTNDRMTAGPFVALDGSGQHWVVIVASLNGVAAADQRLVQVLQSSGAFHEISWLRTSTSTSVLTSFDSLDTAVDESGASLSASTTTVLIGTITTSAAEVFVDNSSGGSSALTGTRQNSAAQYLGVGSSFNPDHYAAMHVYAILEGTGTLSRRKHGFESRWGHHPENCWLFRALLPASPFYVQDVPPRDTIGDAAGDHQGPLPLGVVAHNLRRHADDRADLAVVQSELGQVAAGVLPQPVERVALLADASSGPEPRLQRARRLEGRPERS